MIKEVYYSYLNPENLISLAEQSAAIITNNHPKETAFTNSLTKLNAAIQEAVRAVGKTAKESLTYKVYAADANRDTTFIGFRNHIDAGLKRHRNAIYRAASERVRLVIDKHGRDIHRLPYVEQSTAFNTLLAELDTTTIQEDLKTANATGWIDDLKEDQKDFETVFAQRNIEKANDTTITDKEALRILKPGLKNFYILINAFYIMDEIPEIITSVDEINSAIDRVISSAKR